MHHFHCDYLLHSAQPGTDFWTIVGPLAAWVAAGAAVCAAIWAKRIGVEQNKINKQALDLQDFVELFVEPQPRIHVDEKDQSKIVGHSTRFLVKNVSTKPVYINKFDLNGIGHDIGNACVPPRAGEWYGIPAPESIGGMKLTIFFEDYLGKRYVSETTGEYVGGEWLIRSKKSRPAVDGDFDKVEVGLV